MEIGVYSFGDVQRTKDNKLGSTSDATKNLLEAIQYADKVGLDFFGVGEHHTEYFPASSPATIIAAAAATTKRIKLGSAVSVLSTDDPVRVFQQYSTANIISGGRVEYIAGRGSSTESFPLFGYELKDYEALYNEKLELLLQLNSLGKNESFSWDGKFRPTLNNAKIVPQSDEPFKIWLATGGNPQSSINAAVHGLPIAYAIIGGHVSRFKPLTDLYRAAAEQYGPEGFTPEVSFAVPGFVADDAKDAKDTFWKHWHWTMATLGKVRGFAAPSREHYDYESNEDGALFAGDPEEIARRMVEAHTQFGVTRIFLQMDVGQMPQEKFLHAIELLAKVVKPRVAEMLKETKHES
ncbi:LLM class flavin-dependent oxidoreductase [Candidatus Saccharibacteria bacterium]|nr:LLM class flavin-dependent oxidoreductase [Candidatus Saccharibacteria bacterium]